MFKAIWRVESTWLLSRIVLVLLLLVPAALSLRVPVYVTMPVAGLAALLIYRLRYKRF